MGKIKEEIKKYLKENKFLRTFAVVTMMNLGQRLCGMNWVRTFSLLYTLKTTLKI